MLRSVIIAVMLLVTLSAAPTRINAQEPGDVYWQIAPKGFFADQRIQYALLLLTDTDAIASGAGLQGSLLYGNTEVADFVTQIEKPASEADLLLAAAGFDNPSQQLSETRRCRFWTPPEAESPETLSSLGFVLGEALSAAWSSLGVQIRPCEATTSRDDADILIWEFGQDYAIPPEVFQVDADTFLGASTERPGAIPGGTGGGPPSVSPPSTGDAGLR